MPTSGGGPASRPLPARDAGYARYGYGCAGKVLAQQQLTDERRDNQQRQSGGSFGDSSENEHILHRADFTYVRARGPLALGGC